jgi:hypothetical protein
MPGLEVRKGKLLESPGSGELIMAARSRTNEEEKMASRSKNPNTAIND